VIPRNVSVSVRQAVEATCLCYFLAFSRSCMICNSWDKSSDTNQLWVCLNDGSLQVAWSTLCTLCIANHDGGCSRTGIISLPALRNPMDMPYTTNPEVPYLFALWILSGRFCTAYRFFRGSLSWEICFIWGPLVTATCGGLSTIISSPFRSDHAIRSIGQYTNALSIFCRSPGVAPIANVVPLLHNGSHTSNAVVCELS
jgi:hypothetical protein